MQTATDHITCEVCGLPHRRGVALCEDCGHALGRSPDWPAIRGKRTAHGQQFVVALIITIGMLAFNFALFGGGGYIIVMAPFVWLVMSGYRYRVFSKALSRSTATSSS